ncbi:Monooxygenase 3 [Linum grandiflorum]
MEEEIVVVGAGIAGLATALALHRMGIRSLVLESADSLRATGFGFMAWPNAWKALDALGIGDTLRNQHIRLQGIVAGSNVTGCMVSEKSYNNKERPNGYDEVRCMKRKELIEALSGELPDGTIRFSSKLVSIQESDCRHLKLLHLADGTIIKAKVLIGCDGVNSIVAKWLGFGKPAFASRSSIRGYAHFESEHGFVHKGFQFHGNGIRVGYNPCDANTAYWFFTWTPSTEDKDIGKDPEKAKKFVLSTVGNVPSEMIDVISKTGTKTYASPLRFRYPWELVSGKISKDNVCIAGDALHPMTSDVGQGANMALEDGVILGKCLAEALKKTKQEEEEFERIRLGLRKFGEERRWRSFGVISAAYVIGYIQQSNWWVMKLVKDKLLSPFLGKLLLKNADFDCGQLKILA